MRRKRGPSVSGIFDFLKKKEEPEETYGLPAPRTTLPAFPEAERSRSLIPSERPGFFVKLKEWASGLIPGAERSENALVPFRERASEIVSFIPPSKEEPSYEERKAAEELFWKNLIPEAAAEEKPLESLFPPLVRQETPRLVERAPLPPAGEWVGREAPLWASTSWALPTTYEMHYRLRETWDLPGLFDRTLSETSSGWWRDMVEQSAHTGEPAVLEIEPVAKLEDPYQDIAKFLGIPDGIVELYGRYSNGSELLWKEVIDPMIDRISKALDLLRPAPSLRGSFEIRLDREGTFWIVYEEGRFMGPQEG